MHALLHRPLPARPLVSLALLLALLAPACQKKQSSLKTVPPVLVPSIESEPQPAVPTPEPGPAASATPTTPAPAAPAETEAQKPRPKPHKTIVRAKPEPKAAEPKTEAPHPEPLKPEIATPQPPPEPAKPAAPDSSVQITAAVPSAAVQSQKQNTEALLRSSQMKLAGINRGLSESEQAMAGQARNYITQSTQAIQEGEIERAYNLAVKASLLADELSK